MARRSQDYPEITRPVALGTHRWWRPRWADIALQSDTLVWKEDSDAATNFFAPAGSEPILADFCGLADGSTEGILRFARTYGVLGICEHGLHYRHEWGAGRVPADELRPSTFVSCAPRLVEGQREVFEEPLEVWRRYARNARALVSLSIALRSGHRGARADWAVIMPADPPKDVRSRRMLVAQEVNEWLRDGRVSYGLDWRPTNPVVGVNSGSLFGYLACQLLVRVMQTSGFTFCSECGASFTPSRPPMAGRRHYCPACGRKAKNRANVRAFRARQLAAKGAASK